MFNKHAAIPESANRCMDIMKRVKQLLSKEVNCTGCTDG